MTRIQPVDRDHTNKATADLLDGIQKQLGSVPNLLATLANSVPAAKAYLGFNQSLAAGVLSRRLREQIALVVGQTNHCDYCLAAHTALGKGAGLTDRETFDARRGEAGDDRERAALQFAKNIVTDRGVISDEDITILRDVGYTDGEIVEIVAHVALNIFTNYFNHVAGTEVDFPTAPALNAA